MSKRSWVLWMLLIAVSLFAFAGVAVAVEEQYADVVHYSLTDIVNNKAIYETAHFRNLNFYIEVNGRANTEENQSVVGFLTIPNGTYYYYDSKGNRVNVNGEDRTFDLTYNAGTSNYMSFVPSLDGREVVFLGSDGLLQGKPYTWSLFESTFNGTIPAFRTLAQQRATYVPYIEKTAPNVIEWRMILPENTSKALAVPYSGRYRIWVRDKNQRTLSQSAWSEFAANATPKGSYTVPADVNAQDVAMILVDIQLREEGPSGPRYRYTWDFFVANRSNQGIASLAALEGPLNLEVDGESINTILFRDGYYSYSSPIPVLVADPSVLQATWDYNSSLKTGTLSLKALKSGTTSVSILYRYNDGTGAIGYETVPLTVVVTGSGNDGGNDDGNDGGSGGGGGGCDVGAGALALGIFSVSSAVILRRKSK
ncbi:hypothetical protein FACS1894204_10390 [Synergistales bacterium]|nr:hypothetical protein FACS1894204_10390 [Synergistales bacterium]